MRVRGLIVAILIAWSAPAFAETKAIDPEVQKHFDLGNDLYNEGRYEDALVEYEKAYALSKYWKILYNRGQVLVMLRREPEAIEDFEAYLAEGGSEIPEERRQQVMTDLEKLRRRLAWVILKNAPSGLDVMVDGRVVTKTPLAKPLTIGAGKHVIALRRNGQIVFTKELQIPAGETSEVAVEIAPEPKKPDPVPPPKVEEEGGLIQPAFPITLALGIAAPMRNVTKGRIDVLGAIDFSGAWRPHPLWSIGLFIGGAAGNVQLAQPEDGIDTKATYSYGMGGVRTRLHLLRDRYFDGWLGLDFGIWRETWKFTLTNTRTFEWGATSPAFGLAGGIDFPLSRSFALGGAARLFGTFVDSGSRVGCAPEDSNYCASSALPSSAGGSGLRGFFEVTARLTYSFAYGAH
ncbi:MAG: tetratricopeptide repeat protein [Polyangiales bacterium]